jgi:hypothetical protein
MCAESRTGIKARPRRNVIAVDFPSIAIFFMDFDLE